MYWLLISYTLFYFTIKENWKIITVVRKIYDNTQYVSALFQLIFDHHSKWNFTTFIEDEHATLKRFLIVVLGASAYRLSSIDERSRLLEANAQFKSKTLFCTIQLASGIIMLKNTLHVIQTHFLILIEVVLNNINVFISIHNTVHKA